MLKKVLVHLIVIAIITGLIILSIYFYQQNKKLKNEIKQVTIQNNNLELSIADGFRRVNEDWAKTKNSVMILKDSTDSFVVDGEVLISEIGEKESMAIQQRIDLIDDATNRTVLTKMWGDFRTSKKVRDYVAFVRALSNSIN